MKKLLFYTLIFTALMACTDRFDFSKIKLNDTNWTANDDQASYILSFDSKGENCRLSIEYHNYPLQNTSQELLCERGTDFINLYFYSDNKITHIGNFLSKTQLALSEWDNGQTGKVLAILQKAASNK
ncbi:MAG: hypothetical protein LBV75_07405 [Paludibacter sp.]|jgi:hypothetical protein|nr:hypothetical protein [Paludibacter sp.]